MSPAEIDFLFEQLFDVEGDETAAYKMPKSAAEGVPVAEKYLTHLRKTPDALDALAALTGKPAFPKTGPIKTTPQLNFLFEQLYKGDGTPNKTYYEPETAAKAVPVAQKYLTELRKTPGALDALVALTGKPRLPDSGPIPDAAQMNFLFEQLFDENGTNSTYDDPEKAAKAIPAAEKYLNELRKTPGALDALSVLTDHVLPSHGPLNTDDLNFLFEQLFDEDKNETLAYNEPEKAVESLLQASAYLAALRRTEGALEALTALTGKTLPKTGSLTTKEQRDFLFGLLYTDEGPTLAATEPDKAAHALVPAHAYLNALRSTSGALLSLNNITGQTLPASGPLNESETAFLFEQLYDQNNQPTVAYGRPEEAAITVVHADAYLQALRTTPGALASLEELTGQHFPRESYLAEDQIEALFDLLFEDGEESTAYKDPKKAADTLVHANAYLKALRQTEGALDTVATISGMRLPDSGVLTVDQLRFLMGQLFDAAGNPTLAYTNPVQAAKIFASNPVTRSSSALWIALGIGGALALGLGLTHVLSPTWSILSGVGAATLAFMLMGEQKTLTETSSPVSINSAPMSVTVPKTQTNSLPKPGQGVSASDLAVIDAKASYIAPSEGPAISYIPLLARDGSQNQEATKAIYAQKRWLGTAKSQKASLSEAKAALGYAGAANKNINIAVSPQNNR
jgi:hypothetical protein